MNTKNYFYSVVMVFVTLFYTSCSIVGEVGKGDILTQKCDVTTFTSVEVTSSADVKITTGDSFEVILSDYENLLDLWDIQVVNNTLVVQTKPNTSIFNSRAKVSIVMPDQLQSATVSGSGNIELNSAFPNFNKAGISGSGNISGNVNTVFSNLNLRISGSGNINLKGTADELKALTSGSGNMYLSELFVQDAECTIAGSGDLYVNVEKSLFATISGSGNIIYSGNPVIDVSDSGSGKLIRKN
jgi:hypothetical protein